MQKFNYAKYWTSSTKLALNFSDTVSPLTDKSGNGNNATNNGATVVNSGRSGNAYYFDGSNDYMEMTSNNDLLLNGNYTMHLLVKPLRNSTVVPAQLIYYAGNQEVLVGKYAAMDVYQLKFRAALVYAGSSIVMLTFPIVLGQFYDVFFTTNGSNSHKLYANGVLVDSSSTAITRVFYATNYITIGCVKSTYYSGASAEFSQCSVDYMQIDNSIWTANEIHKFYQELFRP